MSNLTLKASYLLSFFNILKVMAPRASTPNYIFLVTKKEK